MVILGKDGNNAENILTYTNLNNISNSRSNTINDPNHYKKLLKKKENGHIERQKSSDR
jgi:hypothetical protein